MSMCQVCLDYFAAAGVRTAVLMGDFNVTNPKAIAATCDAARWA